MIFEENTEPQYSKIRNITKDHPFLAAFEADMKRVKQSKRTRKPQPKKIPEHIKILWEPHFQGWVVYNARLQQYVTEEYDSIYPVHKYETDAKRWYRSLI